MNPEKVPPSELPPNPTPLIAGVALGTFSSIPSAILVTEGLDKTSTNDTEAITTEPNQWPSELIDPSAMALSLPFGVAVGGIIGWIAMRARQKGESFTGLRKHAG